MEEGLLPSVVAHARGSDGIGGVGGVVVNDDDLTLGGRARFFAVSALSSRVVIESLGTAARV